MHYYTYATRSKTKTNHHADTHTSYPCLVTASCISWVWIGFLDCPSPFWLVRVITFGFGLRTLNWKTLYTSTRLQITDSCWTMADQNLLVSNKISTAARHDVLTVFFFLKLGFLVRMNKSYFFGRRSNTVWFIQPRCYLKRT